VKKESSFGEMNSLFGDVEMPTSFNELNRGSDRSLPDLDALIEEGIIETNSHEDSDIRMPGYHPSQISSRTCVRFYVLHSLPEFHVEQKFNATTHEIFDVGNDIHKRIQRYLSPHLLGTWKCRQCGYMYNANYDENYNPIDKEPDYMPTSCKKCGYKHFKYMEWKIISPNGIRGSIDGIISYNGEIGGIEIKSTKSMIWSKLSVDMDMVKKYIKQFAIYLKELDLGWGKFIFDNKDTHQKKYLTIKNGEVDLSDIYYSIELANEYKKNKKLPKARICDDCEQCPYYRTKYCNPT
jgi:hypothetical protein